MIWPSYSTPWYLPKKNLKVGSYKDHTNVPNSFIYSQNLEKPNVHQQVDKQIMTCPYNGTLYSNRKKPTTDTYKDEHQDIMPSEKVRHERPHVAWPQSYQKSRQGKLTETVDT